MLDIIACSRNNDLLEKSINIINAVLVNYEFDYHIHKFKNNNKSLHRIIDDGSSKIYILDVEMGLDIASLIRRNDFNSIIIFISNERKIRESTLHSRFLALDYICLNNRFEDYLKTSLNIGLEIIYREANFIFKYNHITYRIPCVDITYIEKEAQVKRCIVHTFSGIYYVVSSIGNLSKLLEPTFIRTHQSCLVNIMNIKSIDYINNIIIFNNGEETSLLSEKRKQIIKDYI